MVSLAASRFEHTTYLNLTKDPRFPENFRLSLHLFCKQKYRFKYYLVFQTGSEKFWGLRILIKTDLVDAEICRSFRKEQKHLLCWIGRDGPFKEMIKQLLSIHR